MLPSAKEAIALEMLSAGAAMYGLEMVKRSRGRLGRGTIYVVLDRLEEKGFISSTATPVPGQAGMPRRLYCITALGQRAIAAREAARTLLAGFSLAPGASR